MISLYPDQSDLLDNLRAALSRHQSILLYAAPGFGKTVTAAKMLHGG